MRADSIRKILILDQGDPVAAQLLGKAVEVFGRYEPEYVILKARRTHNMVLGMMEETIREEQPELVLMGATALGEEVAPSLGVRFRTGVAAHCIDIRENESDRAAFMIPAVGGGLAGEIFVPEAKAGTPAIATVKPGIFSGPSGKSYDDVFASVGCRIIDVDAMVDEGALAPGSKTQGAFRMIGATPRERGAGSIADADIIVCGGYGLGSEEVWNKLQALADKIGGAAACTRAALDAGWGCSEDAMIGTSGKAVRPKVYIGFGISGAAHHMCGIAGAETIISINSDKEAEVFSGSDYKGVFDAEKVLDALLGEIE